jgi:hypothetical protein
LNAKTLVLILAFGTASAIKAQTANRSALADGRVYKVAVQQTGLCRISYSFLKNDLGISDLDNIDPRTIQLFGNQGGRLPESNAETRAADLTENAIYVEGESDGRFDANDFIIFNAQGADKWRYDASSATFRFDKNVYDDYNYYFIKIAGNTGKRVGQQLSLPNANYLSTTFNDYYCHELDRYNLLHLNINTAGSGQEWLGEYFDAVRAHDIPNVRFDNIDSNSPVQVEARMALRNKDRSTRFSLTVDGNNFLSQYISAVSKNEEAPYAYAGQANGSFLPKSDLLATTVSVADVSAEGWLDYVQFNAKRKLIYTNAPMAFRDVATLGKGSATFSVSNANANLWVWDISDPLSPILQQSTFANGELRFSLATNGLKEFIVFDKNADLQQPKAIGGIANQNLHGIDAVEMAIIYHPKFAEAANALAAHRQAHNGMKVALVNILEIFNEFSSGRQDPTAIRDFAKMLYGRYPGFKYLLLFGDGSFDYKNTSNQVENHNYIPVYETPSSFDPIYSFPTDDYYALLDGNEGSNLQGGLDIAVGRLPVRFETEAKAAVDKIIRYETASSTLGDWRNRLIFVADDEDNNLHLKQADRVATQTQASYNNLDLEKIYFDAYQQEASAGGNSYPAASEAINNDIFKGVLVVNYMGHGGPQGWAQERVLNETHIASWENINRLPLFITATCTFAPYDNPLRLSAGEQLILKENGGAIALFTTVRPVYSSSNERLTRASFERIFEKNNGEAVPIGEVLRLAKNANSADTLQPNARKYALLGDPALRLALPRYQVLTTAASTDTLKALGSASISGIVADDNGNRMEGFNGTVYVTVYDKPLTISTLSNDGVIASPKFDFSLRKNIIFKGAAQVVQGAFQLDFTVPKDINYQYGQGKISYYAQDGTPKDAAGFHYITVGGTTPNAVSDNEPPQIQVFMNNDQFVFGGITDESPVLYAKVSDNIGMNIAGLGIGHDMTATLDGNEANVYPLNDFYQGTVDDPKRGILRFPLTGMAPGRHEITVKAWDVSNNMGAGSTEFVVAENAKAALAHVLNYPNPFSTHTRFLFEHNLAGQTLDVRIRIFTLSGKLVKTLQTTTFAEGFRIDDIEWDGKDDFGEKLAKGVYLYRLDLEAAQTDGTSLKIESRFEKLVILN